MLFTFSFTDQHNSKINKLNKVNSLQQLLKIYITILKNKKSIAKMKQ